METMTNNTLEFFVPMLIPTVTHQEKKIAVQNGKPIVYEPAELKDARSKFEAHLSPYAPDCAYRNGVRLMVKWLFPISGNHHSDGEYKTTKPDTDNLIKLLKDVMTKLGFWHDDAQVCSEINEKFFAVHPGIYIRLEEV